MMIYLLNKNIVAWKLGRELAAAGIPHNGMSLFGDRLEIYLVNPQQAGLVQAVLDAHDGIDTASQRAESADDDLRTIPGWATWTEAQALAWWTSNLADAQVDAVANLADARALMKKQNAAIKSMARMLIAMRNRMFPQLPDG